MIKAGGTPGQAISSCPHGIRPRGPFGYTTNCTPREESKSETGTGVFWAAVPEGRHRVITKVAEPDR